MDFFPPPYTKSSIAPQWRKKSIRFICKELYRCCPNHVFCFKKQQIPKAGNDNSADNQI